MAQLNRQYDVRDTPQSVVQTVVIPSGSGTYAADLSEVPVQTTPSDVSVAEGATPYTEGLYTPASVTEFVVDYDYSRVTFLKDAAERTVVITYSGKGTVARAEWANQQTVWNGRNFYIAGQPSASIDTEDAPTGIVYIPTAWLDTVTIQRLTLHAQTNLGLTGTTRIRVSNMEDWSDVSAEYQDITLYNTGGAGDYWAIESANVEIDLSGAQGLIYIRAYEIGGHADMNLELLPA